MSKKKVANVITRRTEVGTSATMASRSQIRPLETKINAITASDLCHQRTCFQRMCAKPKTLPALRRMRSKPMSMMKSNATSVVSEPITVGLVVSKLRRAQVFSSGDHVDRSYVCQVSQAGSKQLKSEFTRTTPAISL
jgi:hypothetical protein